jgi:hypothetical protein
MNFLKQYLFIFFFFTTSLFAATQVVNDTFDNGSLDGWQGDGYTYNDNGWMYINHNDIATKEFDFGSGYANKNITFTLKIYVPDKWEKSGWGKDYIRIYSGSTEIEHYSYDGGTHTESFTTTLDSNGHLLLKIEADSTASDEWAGIDYVIAYVDGEIPPYIKVIPDQKTKLDTLFTLHLADYIVTTNNDSILSYSLSGTLPSGLSFNSETGEINGIADTEETQTLSITVTDNDGASNTRSFTIIVSNTAETNNDFINFRKRISFFTQGDLVSIGNTFTVHPKSPINCDTYTTGEYVDPVSSNNKDYIYCHYNVDQQQDYAATTAELIIPPNSKIKWAGLYWQALTDSTNTSKYSNLTIRIRRDENTTTYHNVVATEVNYKYQFSSNILPKGSSAGSNYADIYSAFADVTYLFQQQGWKSGHYTVATSDVMEGREKGFGVYGAWNLIVVYENDLSTFKSFTVFDGWKKVSYSSNSNDVKININGFYTPKSTPINANVAVFAGEGDYNINGDKLKAIRQSDNQIVEFLNNNNPDKTNQTFSSYVKTDGDRRPQQHNNNGIDIQSYEIGSSTTYNLLQPEQKSMEFHFTSTGDLYFPSVIAFATEIYTPKLCYDFSVKQDGYYFRIDRNAYPEAVINAPISPSKLDITVYLRNKEADIPAENIALKSDVNNTVFSINASNSTDPDHVYVSNRNGARLIDRGTLQLSAPLPEYDTLTNYSASSQGKTNGHDLLKGIGNLGSKEYVYAKYSLHPNGFSGITDINQSLGLSISFYITIDGSKIIYENYPLGSEHIPLCPPADAYTPKWGQFNIVEANQPEDDIKNNIRTQISRKPFSASVVFDSTPKTGDNTAPDSDINTTVIVEIIDIDAFGDLNASCANPDSAVSKAIFQPLSYTPNSHQNLIITQGSNYYNFAVKNAAFRIWYFTDANATLIQNWHAITDDNGKTLLSIDGLYDPSIFPECATDCTNNPTTTQCFNCIYQNYAKPICSRDNFSVRPESYAIKIYDNQQSPLITAPKNDLSLHYGYDTSFAATPTDRMHLAADYKYRYDINSTGHESIANTPGYTRYFNGASDYNATLLWDSSLNSSVCNDTNNQTVKFYMSNGIVVNQDRNITNIGKYRLNIIDKSWTAVDWDPAYLTHHTTANGFNTESTDCIINSTSTVLNDGKHGCFLSSNHGSDGNGHYYRDIQIFSHPYTFDLNGTLSNAIIPTVGPSHTNVSNSSYLYYADLNVSNDENMSYHLNGSISAMGANKSALTNFVNQCYAVPLKLSISTSDRTLKDSSGNMIAYTARFHDLNASGFIIHSLDINYSNTASPSADIVLSTVQNSTKGYFPKAQNGETKTILNLNYTRNKSIPLNPKALTFIKYKAECLNASTECTFSANMVHNATTTAELDLNSTIPIEHYYGRTHNPRQVFTKTSTSSATTGKDLIYYEIYCDGTSCDKTILPDGVTSEFTDDPRWFVNTKHTYQLGSPGNANQKGYAVANGLVKETTQATGNATPTDYFGLTYDGTRGYPYKTTMENNASGWLIYNKYNPAATKNSFDVEFIKNGGNWAGVRETNSTTKKNASNMTNRRALW